MFTDLPWLPLAIAGGVIVIAIGIVHIGLLWAWLKLHRAYTDD